MTISPADTYVFPILPARDFDELIAFYKPLGFTALLHVPMSADDPGFGYLILARANIELHFFPFRDLDPAQSYAGCYIRTSRVDDLFAEISPDALPTKGIPRYLSPEDKPWQMREFHIVDPSGNLIKFGQPLENQR